MLIKTFNQEMQAEGAPEMPGNCTACSSNDATIEMHGYTETSMRVCRNCALQLARKLLEDLCEVITDDRNG